MFQVCVFGSYDGRLRANKRVFFTLFGECVLRRPTLARQLVTGRSAQPGQAPARPHHLVITLMGSTKVKAPTLAEEFLDLREGLRGGVITLPMWDRLVADLARDDGEAFLSLTLFASFEEASLPTENEEVDALALQRHLGNISDSALQILQLGVGQDDVHRRAVLRQAIAAAG